MTGQWYGKHERESVCVDECYDEQGVALTLCGTEEEVSRDGDEDD